MTHGSPVVFISAIRHPETTRQMARVYELLALTGRTLLAQSDSNWRWVIASNEAPRHGIIDRRIFTVPVDFPPVFSRTNSDKSSPDTFKADKGTKLMAAWVYAKTFHPRYLVVLDGDDWIHRDVVAFLRSSGDVPVWSVGDGYVVDLHARRWKRRAGMVRYCGSGFAFTDEYLSDTSGVRLEGGERLTREEMFALTKPGFITECLGDHHVPYRHASAVGNTLREIPFASMCWVINNGMNFSQPKSLSRGRALDERFLKAFGLSDSIQESRDGDLLNLLTERAAYVKSVFEWRSTRRKEHWVF